MVGDWYLWTWEKWPRDSWEKKNNISRKGQKCRLVCCGSKNILIEFEDGARFVTSRRGLRKLQEGR